MAEPGGGAVAAVITAAIEHSEEWGRVWFGLLFWGSVFNAIALEVVPDATTAARVVASFGAGLAIGVVGKLRGRWL